MVAVAKWLTHRIVIPTYVGSIPISHPIIMKAYFFIFYIIFLASCSQGFVKKDSSYLSIENYTEKEKEALRVLENWESYRPASCSDASRNPFQQYRYNFNDE